MGWEGLLFNAILNTYVWLAILIGISTITIILVIAVIMPKDTTPRENNEEKTKNTIPRIPTKIKGVKVLLRDGNILRLVDAKVRDDGSLIVGDRLYTLKNNRPFIFVKGFKSSTGSQLYIIDAKYNVQYEFEDINPDKIEKELSKANLKPAIMDAKVLRHYIASNIIQKILGKVTVSKGEVLAYFLSGGFFVYILQYFLLPIIMTALGGR